MSAVACCALLPFPFLLPLPDTVQTVWDDKPVITGRVVCSSDRMGWASPDLSEALELKLLGIVQLGIGGYIASRGVEKVAATFRR